MIFLKRGIYFKLKDFPFLVKDIDYNFSVPNISFVKKLSFILRKHFNLPIIHSNIEDFFINTNNIGESEFLVSFPNLVLMKKSDFSPTLAISPVYDLEITMPIEVMYSDEKNDTEKSYTIPDFVEHRDFDLEGMSELSLLYEIYTKNNSTDFVLKILRDEDDFVYFSLNKDDKKISLKKIDLENEDKLHLIDKGWMKFVNKGFIRFFGHFLNGKFTIDKKNEIFVLDKVARQPNTTWEINEPYAPLEWAFPANVSSDKGLYLQVWPYQWAKYPGENILSTLLELMRTLGDKSLEEKVPDKKKVKKIDDVEDFLKEMNKEGSICWYTWKNGYSDKTTFKNFLKGWLIKKADEKDLTRLTDKDKVKFYNEVKMVRDELQKKFDGTELKSELFKRLKITFPDLKDETIFRAIDKIMKEANVYEDKEQPVILGDDYGTELFPHHDFPENTNDVKIDIPFHLDELDRSYIFDLPTAGAYLIALPNGDQFIVDEKDLELFKKKSLKKKLSKQVIEVIKKIGEEKKEEKPVIPSITQRVREFLDPLRKKVWEAKGERISATTFDEKEIEKNLGLVIDTGDSSYVNAILVSVKGEKVEKNSEGKPYWIIPLEIGIAFEKNIQHYTGEVWVSFSKLKDEEDFSFNFNIDEVEVFVMLKGWRGLGRILEALYNQLREIKRIYPKTNLPDFKMTFRFNILGKESEETVDRIRSEIEKDARDLFEETLKYVLKSEKNKLEGFEKILEGIKGLKKEVNIRIEVMEKEKSDFLISFLVNVTLPQKTFEIPLNFSLKPVSSSSLIEIDGIKVGVEIGDTKEFGDFLEGVIKKKLEIYKNYGVLTKINVDIYAPSETTTIELTSGDPLKEIFNKIIELVKKDLIKMWGETLKGKQEMQKMVAEGKKITPKEWVKEQLGEDKFTELEKEIDSKGYYVDEVTNLMIQEYPNDKNFYLITKR